MHPKFTLALANEHLSSVPYTSVDVRWLRLYISSSLALARLQESGEAVETLDKAIIVAGAGRDGDELGKEVFELLRDKQRGMVLPRLDVPVPASLACMKHKPELGDGGCPCASVRTDMRDDDNGDSDGDSVIDDDRTTRTEQDKLKHLSDLLVASHPIPRISPTSASSSPPNDHTTNHPAQPYITKITWPAMHRWSDPNYLLSIAGPGRYVPVEIGRAYDEPGWGQRIVPFEQFLRRAWRCPELLDTGGRTAGGEASDGRGEGPESKVVGSEDGGRGGAGEEGVGRPTKRRRLGGYPTIATDQPRRAETETETAASQVDGAFTASPANDPLSVTATATKFQCQPRVPPPVDLQGTGKKELGPPMYLAQYDLFRQFPELQRDISMPDQVWAVDSDESADSDECDDDDDDNDEDDHLDDREDGDRCADRSVQPDQNSGNGTDQDDRDIRPAGGQRARSRSKPKIRGTKKSRPRPADGPILNIWLGSGNGELVSPAHTVRLYLPYQCYNISEPKRTYWCE